MLSLIEEVDEMTLHDAKDVGTARQPTMFTSDPTKNSQYSIRNLWFRKEEQCNYC